MNDEFKNMNDMPTTPQGDIPASDIPASNIPQGDFLTPPSSPLEPQSDAPNTVPAWNTAARSAPIDENIPVYAEHEVSAAPREEAAQEATPYQTPVRGTSAAGASARQQSNDGQSSTTQGGATRQGADSFSAYQQWQQAQRAQQPSTAPESDARTSSEGQNSAAQGSADSFSAYQQWQQERRAAAQQNNTAQDSTAQNGGVGGEEQERYSYQEWQQAQSKKPQKAKKSHKRAAIVTGSLFAACAIFVGGVFGGSYLLSGAPLGGADSQAVADAANASTPTLNISTASADGGLTGDQIYLKVAPSVVSIVSASLLDQGTASGSGVIMTEDGYIITNAHVIEGSDKITVITSDGMQYNAEIIGADKQTDLAVLKVNDKVTFTPAEFGDSDALKAGEQAYAIGSPGGVQLSNTITSGSISAISRDITIDDRVMTLIQTDASINPGNSGGALINKNGQVVGITSAKLGLAYYEGLGFAIPIDSAKEIVDQLITYGFVPGRPAIGVSGYNLDAEIAAYNNVPQGVIISEVDPRSAAATEGIQAKDIIIGVNGKTITTMDEVNATKDEMKAGDKLKLTVYRLGTGQTLDFTITLSDQNDLTETTTVQQQPETNSRTFQIPDGYFGG